MSSSIFGRPDRARLLAGRYRLGALLGTGAAGQVLEAEDCRTGAVVAVKLLRPELAQNRRAAKRLKREARSLFALDHPNIVKVLDAGRADDGRPYLVMERLTGPTLAAELRGGPLAIGRAVEITLQVLEAIGYAHGRGVLHRDLKPGNIMIVSGAQDAPLAKVCDFGMAKLLLEPSRPDASDSSASTGVGSLCGTPAYMSPEQACGDALDPRSDLYTIGVLLYELVTGDVPFRARSPMAVLSRHLTHVPDSPSARRLDAAIPRALERLILRALAKSRDERPANAASFARELRDAAGGAPPSALAAARPAAAQQLPPTLLDSDWPSLRRWRRPVLVAAGALAVAGMGGAALRRSPPAPTVERTTATLARSTPVEAPGRLEVVPSPAPKRSIIVRTRSRLAANPAKSARPASPAAAPATYDQLLSAQRLLDEGQIAESCRAAQAAADSHDREAAPHRFLARCLMRLGRLADARSHFRRYLQLEPEAEDAPFIREILR